MPLLSFLVKVFAIFYPNAIANAVASATVAANCPAIFMLPEAAMFPPEILPVVVIFAVILIAETTFPLKLNPAAFKLPLVTLPVTETVVPV
jgi:hypothetical protein